MFWMVGWEQEHGEWSTRLGRSGIEHRVIVACMRDSVSCSEAVGRHELMLVRWRWRVKTEVVCQSGFAMRHDAPHRGESSDTEQDQSAGVIACQFGQGGGGRRCRSWSCVDGFGFEQFEEAGVFGLTGCDEGGGVSGDQLEFGCEDEADGVWVASFECGEHGAVVVESGEVGLFQGKNPISGEADAFEVGGGRGEGDCNKEDHAGDECDPAAHGFNGEGRERAGGGGRGMGAGVVGHRVCIGAASVLAGVGLDLGS